MANIITVVITIIIVKFNFQQASASSIVNCIMLHWFIWNEFTKTFIEVFSCEASFSWIFDKFKDFPRSTFFFQGGYGGRY